MASFRAKQQTVQLVYNLKIRMGNKILPQSLILEEKVV